VSARDQLTTTTDQGSVLWTLEEIGRLVSHSGNPAETLNNLVHLIKRRFGTDVCSVYLLEPDRVNLVLAVLRARQLWGGSYSIPGLRAALGSAFGVDEAELLANPGPAANLTAEEIATLHAAIGEVLRDAVERARGLAAAELKAEKKLGMRVHGRAGQACPVCGDTVREVSFADSALQYCPACQTGGKPLADRRMSRLLR